MNKLYRKFLGFLAKRIGMYFFVEIEEMRAPDAVPLRKHRIIVRALTRASAIQAGYNYSNTKKVEEGKEYGLSAIRKI